MADAAGFWDVAKAVVDHTDSLVWAVVAVWFAARFGPVIGKALLPHVSKVKAGGFEVEFVRRTIDAAANAAVEHSEIITSTVTKKVEISQRDREIAAARALRCQEVLKDKLILWVDDELANNRLERKLLQSFGLVIEQAQTNKDALAALAPVNHGYDLVLSDIVRPQGHPNGLKLLEELNRKGQRLPVIFYITELDERKPLPLGAFGLTNRPDELLHLVIDALERGYKPTT